MLLSASVNRFQNKLAVEFGLGIAEDNLKITLWVTG